MKTKDSCGGDVRETSNGSINKQPEEENSSFHVSKRNLERIFNKDRKLQSIKEFSSSSSFSSVEHHPTSPNLLEQSKFVNKNSSHNNNDLSRSSSISSSSSVISSASEAQPFTQNGVKFRGIKARSIYLPETQQPSGYVNMAYQFDEHDDVEKKPQKLKQLSIAFDESVKIHSPNETVNQQDNESNQNSNQPVEPKKTEDSKEKDTKEMIPEWDRFVTLPPPDEDETQINEWVEISIRWLKLFAYFFTFVMVLVLSVLSKSIILLMTSMTNVNHSITVCNSDESFNIEKPLDHDKEYMIVYHANQPERIAWVWSLYFAIIAPYFFAFGRSIRIIYFKTFKLAKIQTMMTVWLAESLHCIGLSILMFVVIPKIDVIKGVMMMNSVCLVPSLLRLMVDKEQQELTQKNNNEEIDNDQSNKTNPILTNMLNNKWLAYSNCFLQLLSLILWTLVGYYEKIPRFYFIPIGLILVSFEWWENFVVPDSMKNFAKFLDSARQDLNKSRYFVFAIMSLWKILLIFSLMLLNEYASNGSKVVQMFFKHFTDGFNSTSIQVVRDKRNFDSSVLFDNERHQMSIPTPLWPVWILFIHVALTYLAYAFAKFTCKVCFQTISFAIPLCLTVPVTVSLLWTFSSLAFQDKCKTLQILDIFQYIYWNIGKMDTFDFSNALLSIMISVVWLVSFINQVSNTLHIWKETNERLASTEQLFVSPMYNAALVDQSLVLNRRCLKLTFNPDEEDQKDFEANLEEKQQLNPNESNEKTNKKSSIEKLNENPVVSYNPLYDWSDHVDELVDTSPSLSIKHSDTENDDDWTKDWLQICKEMGIEEDSIDPKTDPKDDETIRIFICATMWHEDRNEMIQMLKAVLRLDYEQGLRRIAKKNFGDDVKKVIYEMEVNIFFDDAFEQGASADEDDRVVNRFVEQLIDTIGEAANQVFEKNLDFAPPTIVPTPYGGKLIWILPMGTNRLIAHVKDKNLIRHRKRWSQCMYMYYLLGYRLAARKDLDNKRKKTIMNNTFVLALDGDINFRPQAVDLVVDLMKKNNNLGAACGRIHPIGSGPIVWYQMFEYAMGHWLQKATEHVIGCVLCSPGCFSLFRARALMDKSVMNKYTTKPSIAQHYVQYDQGEDRWLCTLLLQRGWRIEYCAASDSYTHAPEGFAEFYTQRRRWGPSTMANILDLLADYKQTVKQNDNISYLYILYQGFLMLGTIISPGTIFLMVVSAMNTVMGLSTQQSLLCNMIPLLAFIYVSLKFEDNNIKITFATILSVIYALLMLAVLVGTGIDMYTQGFFSPNSLFFSAMMASFLVAAILHPQEFVCVLPLPIYMLFIPSMYMLLTIYSITNMNVVSWGTREVKAKLSAKELAKQKEEEEAKEAAKAAAKKQFKFMNLSDYGSKNGLFTCMCCSSAQNDDMKNLIQEVKTEVKTIGKVVNQQVEQDKRLSALFLRDSMKPGQSNQNDSSLNKDSNQSSQKDGKTAAEHESSSQQTTDSKSNLTKKPRWITNNARLNRFPLKNIPQREQEFWVKMIDKYLLPLDEDLKEKERIEIELADLRNKFVFAFSFVNIIFILFVFMLQVHKDVFGIDIPTGSKGINRTYIESEDRYLEEPLISYTRMDPINLTLVVFFGAILIVQCIGMFIHRFGTLAHLLAYTEINEKKQKFDYGKFIADLIRHKRKQQEQLDDDLMNNNGPDERTSFNKPPENHQVKPNQYDEMIGRMLQEIKTNQKSFDEMPKIIRQNTVRAMNLKDKHLKSFHRSNSILSRGSVVTRNSSTTSQSTSVHPMVNRSNRSDSVVSLGGGQQHLSKHRASNFETIKL